MITEADPANATVSKYDYGMDQLVRLDNRNEGRSFFHLDILRSTVSLTDAMGGDRQSIFYDAWGNERDRVGVSTNKFTFTGHEKDEETGLIYAKARFYDAETGRFLSQDAVAGDNNDPPSLHRYSYVKQRPLFLVDPTGNHFVVICPGCEFVSIPEEMMRLDIAAEGFKHGAEGLVKEPFREIQDVGLLVFALQEGLDVSRLELTSGLGRAQFERMRHGEGAISTSLGGSADVAFAVGTVGIGPFLEGQVQLARALESGQITIDQYQYGLGELAGGATAVAVLAAITEGVPSRVGGGELAPKATGEPRPAVVAEQSGSSAEPSMRSPSGPLKNPSGNIEQTANTARSYNPQGEASGTLGETTASRPVPEPAIKEGDVGAFGELKGRSKGSGLEIHESPSRAAQEKAFVRQFVAENGRPPTPKEINQFRKGNPSIALRPETHAHTDTFRGRNTAAKSTNDAGELDQAAARGAADVVRAGEQTGVDLTEQAAELQKLHGQRKK